MTQAPEDLESSEADDRGATSDAASSAELASREGDIGRAPWEYRWVRVAAIVVIVGLAAGMVLLGNVSVLLGVTVFLPVCVALIAAESGHAAVARSARIWATVGLIVWLSVAGGAPMLAVVAAVILMIFLHELGHYLAAKRAGMLATEFFIGFGPRIWSFKRGETEFGLKAIPAGAYVKILGMNNLEDVDPALEHRTYRQAPFRDRLLVAVAGSGMHFLIALVLLFVQFTLIGAADDQRWTVGAVSVASPAEGAGLASGDRLVSLDGEPVGSFDEFRDVVSTSDPGATTVVYERDGEQQVVNLDLTRRARVIGTVGDDVNLVETSEGVAIARILENGRGGREGLMEGQTVRSINDVPISMLDDVSAALEQESSGTVVFDVESGSETLTAAVDLGSAVDVTEPSSFVGVGAQADLMRVSPTDAFGESVQSFGSGIWASIEGVGTVFWPPNLWSFITSSVTGDTQDATQVPTPADQVEISSDEARPTSIFGAIAYGADLTAENASFLIAFLIGLNIFIGVFNLIPLLPFDGGHVAIAVYEKAQELRKRQKNRYIADITRMIPVAYMVLIVLGVVGILAMYLDLTQGVAA